MNLAPVALFVYCRPAHTQRTIAALQANELASETDLIIFSDGAKGSKDSRHVDEVRRIAHGVTGFRSLSVVEKSSNTGLANSIVHGVSELCERHGRVIVLEDDLISAPSFLTFVNRSLDLYADDERVMQVSGYMLPVHVSSGCDALFLPFTSSWGWGTWSRAWRHYDRHAVGWQTLKDNREQRHKFDIEGAYDYSGMLEASLRGDIDSWAIRWYLTVFMRNGVVLYPTKSLIQNTGFDGSGVHCGNELTGESIDPKFTVEHYPACAVEREHIDLVCRLLAGRNSLFRKSPLKLARMALRRAAGVFGRED
jgi:hypothetical protein